MRIGALLGMLASATVALVAKREVVPDSDVPLDYGTRASVGHQGISLQHHRGRIGCLND
jgi:hypothetical protein